MSIRYKQCYDEATNGFDEIYTREKGVNRDDRVHGSLLVLNELLRCSNAEWERSYEELMDRVQYQQGQQASVSLFQNIAVVINHWHSSWVGYSVTKAVVYSSCGTGILSTAV
jgi:FKBP12-rapamycin complex-associated protein